MERRTARRYEKKARRSAGLKRAAAILLCAVFFFCAIYVTDISTQKMMMSKDDKYAFGIFSAGKDILRLDMAGEHYMINYGKLRKLTGSAVQESGRLIKEAAAKIKNKTGN